MFRRLDNTLVWTRGLVLSLVILCIPPLVLGREYAGAIILAALGAGALVLVSRCLELARQSSHREKTLKRNLLQACKLASLGEFSTGVAHEINNPLSIILQEAELIRTINSVETPLGPEDRDIAGDCAEQIILQARRCGDITHKLLDLARRRTPVAQMVDVGRLARDMVALVRRECDPEAMAVNCSFDPDLPLVATDPPLVKQILLNLLNNAVQATDGRGTVDVSTRRDGDFLRIEVRDDGPGVAPENMKRIFHPFFSTKEPGQGTGLGLSISLRIARQLGGDVTVASQPGRGAAFTLSIPIKRREPENER